ncbi:MAG TPA: 3-hydroxyacyl-CoA dehydrogenase family protein [Bacteroidetes bacterium]|nr:3-hydroxyacyl-CoA dehydrogenase family protein [Bacteroidota bacterium]
MTESLEDYALGRSVGRKGTLKKVGIIGCGTMGQEIARVVAQNGIDVVFIDVSEERVKEIFHELEITLDEVINHWGLTRSDKRAILSRIHGSTDYHDIQDCDLIVETINFNKPGTSLEIRKDVFRRVEEVVSPEAVITSNTATLMISELAGVLEHPERAVGLHFLTSAAESNVVEVVRGVKTNDESFEFVTRFARMIGKKVIASHESPGNISTRLIVTLINEACELLMEGVASAGCIDQTMKYGFGLQFGPLELADKIGLDKLIKWMDNLYMEFGERKFKPSPIIKRLYRAGMIGRKTGVGFYKYKDGKITGETITCPEIK